MGPELGWCPDVPDARDFLLGSSDRRTVPPLVDLREYEFGAFERWNKNQSHMSCAVALMGMLDWQTRKWSGQKLDGSPDFLYFLTIRVWGGGGSHGVGLRCTLKTLRRFGTPPGTLYAQAKPHLFSQSELFGFADRYRKLTYIRLDSPGESTESRLTTMKHWLMQGNPFLIGFAVPGNIQRSSTIVTLDLARGGTIGGSAGVVMGFDDDYPVAGHVHTGRHRSNHLKHGAFLVRTCWGTDWGSNGFVWLPYAFVECQFALNAWATQGLHQ